MDVIGTPTRQSARKASTDIKEQQETVVAAASGAGTPRKSRRLSESLLPPVVAEIPVVGTPTRGRKKKVDELVDSKQQEEEAKTEAPATGTPRKSTRRRSEQLSAADIPADICATPPRHRKVSELSEGVRPGTPPVRKSRRLSGGGLEEPTLSALPLTPTRKGRRLSSSCVLDLPAVIEEEVKVETIEEEEEKEESVEKDATMEVIAEAAEEEKEEDKMEVVAEAVVPADEKSSKVEKDHADSKQTEKEVRGEELDLVLEADTVQKSEAVREEAEEEVAVPVTKTDSILNATETQMETEDTPAETVAKTHSVEEAVKKVSKKDSPSAEATKTQIVAKSSLVGETKAREVDMLQKPTTTTQNTTTISSSNNKENQGSEEGKKVPPADVIDPLELLQRLMLPQVPRQKPKSGKFWKADRSQFRAIRDGMSCLFLF